MFFVFESMNRLISAEEFGYMYFFCKNILDVPNNVTNKHNMVCYKIFVIFRIFCIFFLHKTLVGT
jgi:hypothetical protein